MQIAEKIDLRCNIVVVFTECMVLEYKLLIV